MAWSVLSNSAPYQSRAGFWFIDTILQDGAERRYIQTKYSRDLPAPSAAIRDALLVKVVAEHNKPNVPMPEVGIRIMEALKSTTDVKAALQQVQTIASAEVTKIDATPGSK